MYRNKSYKVLGDRKSQTWTKLPHNGTKREKQKQNEKNYHIFYIAIY